MAYRPIRTSYWSDPYILELERDEKLLYMYLLTNDATTQCGIYEIPLRRVEFETGFSGERIYEMFHKFQSDGKIQYSLETREIAIINWRKYNENMSPKTMTKVANELSSVKNPLLILLLYDPQKPLLDKTFKKSGERVVIKNPWETYFLENPELMQQTATDISNSSKYTPSIPHPEFTEGVSIPHPTDSDSYTYSDSETNTETEQGALSESHIWPSEPKLCMDIWVTCEKCYGTFMPNRDKQINSINQIVGMATQRGEPRVIVLAMMKKFKELKDEDATPKGFWRKQPYLPATLVSLWAQVWEEAKLEAQDDAELEDMFNDA
jgi:hypothetical protein